MRAREAGIIGGGITVGLVVVLAGFVAVGQALAIDDQQGSPLDVAPLVVGTAPAAAPLAVPLVEQEEPAPTADPEVVAVEAVTAPEPRRAVPAPPSSGGAQPAAPVAPPAVEAPPPAAPAPPAEPERPSKADLKRWIENRSSDEALAWAKAHGWTEEHIRAALHEYGRHFEGRQ